VKTTRLAAIAVGASLALAPTAQAAPAKERRPCAAPGSTTLARSIEARVFTRSRGDDHRLIGCLRRNDKRRRLFSWYNCGCSTGDDPYPDVGLGGRYVAVNTWKCVPGGDATSTCTGRLRVIDLRSGRVRYTTDTGNPLRALLVQGTAPSRFCSANG